MRIKYGTTDGSSTLAAMASIALEHWYMRTTPKIPLPDNPQCFEVYVTGGPHPAPYDSLFLPLVLSGIERIYGTAPEISNDLLNEDWYQDLPESFNDHKAIIEARDNQDFKVVRYEAACWNILNWLVKYGDVINLEIS